MNYHWWKTMNLDKGYTLGPSLDSSEVLEFEAIELHLIAKMCSRSFFAITP